MHKVCLEGILPHRLPSGHGPVMGGLGLLMQAAAVLAGNPDPASRGRAGAAAGLADHLRRDIGL